ncbi:MAG TPA: DUF192 domain-containing protein, partial [Rhodospirillaceae bacterium]|nr:DUF192 domain-containing protein [Rhodospirillaceae bacterium]
MYRRLFLYAALSLGLLGAAPAVALAQDVTFPVSSLTIVTSDGAEHEFTVEVASDDYQRARGLMFRDSLAPDHGMLFDYKRDIQASMWMKNTL